MTTQYTGTFSVFNNTGSTLTSIVIQHSTTNNGVQRNAVASLDNGAVSGTASFVTSSNDTDHWSVSAQGRGLLTGEEDCGFESEDEGGNVLIILNAWNFGIVNPASSCCMSNSYDQT
jgi:hypothetical protein